MLVVFLDSQEKFLVLDRLNLVNKIGSLPTFDRLVGPEKSWSSLIGKFMSNANSIWITREEAIMIILALIPSVKGLMIRATVQERYALLAQFAEVASDNDADQILLAIE